ncbi:MAG: metalloregulator ArsR/SmtB family transcription factor [Pseudomonadota bacterium]
MSEQSIFRAIADSTRRDILQLLSEREMSVNEIASNFSMTRPAIAKHLNILREGQLLKVTQKGRERIHTLTPEALKTVADWVSYYDRFWDDRLAQLKTIVEAEDD